MKWHNQPDVSLPHLAVDKVHEGTPCHILHDDVHHLADEDGLQQVDDICVLQIGQDIDFLLDLLNLADVPEVAGVNLLDGHQVTCGVHHAVNQACLAHQRICSGMQLKR